MREAPVQIISVSLPMGLMVCATCSIPFGVPEDFYRRRMEDGRSFTCPVGHPNAFADGQKNMPVHATKKPHTSSLESRALQYLNDKSGVVVSTSEVARAIDGKYNTVRTVLSILKRKGKAVNVGYGQYRSVGSGSAATA